MYGKAEAYRPPTAKETPQEDSPPEVVIDPFAKLVEELRQVFPHGHKEFLPTTLREIQLHSDKNHDYAAGGSALGNFDRVSAILALYPGLSLSDRRVVAIVYMLKQLDAVLWGLAKRITQKVEGLNDRLGDISIYAKIAMCMGTEDPPAALEDEPQGTFSEWSGKERY